MDANVLSDSFFDEEDNNNSNSSLDSLFDTDTTDANVLSDSLFPDDIVPTSVPSPQPEIEPEVEPEVVAEEPAPAPTRMGATGLDLQIPLRNMPPKRKAQSWEQTKEEFLPTVAGMVGGVGVGAAEVVDLGLGVLKGLHATAFPDEGQSGFEPFLNGLITQLDEGGANYVRQGLLSMAEEQGYNEDSLTAMDQALTVGSFIGIGGLIKGGVKKGAKVGAKSLADETGEAFFNRRMNINKAKEATTENIEAKRVAAQRVAEENQEIAEDLILNFENKTNKVISTRTKDGRLVIDPAASRKAGVETTEKLTEDNRNKLRRYIASDVETNDAALLAGMGDDLTQPLLKPEKFDALIATIADLKKDIPEAFKTKYHTKADGSQGKEYNLIDHLFELTVDEKLIAGDKLIDLLNKYNISFEDYILTVVGSGSEAGKTLQKLSQIKRMRPANELLALQNASTVESASKIRQNVMRIENIRRGGLVSQVATAARNLQSGGIRAPLEGLGNVMDTALYNAGDAEGIVGKGVALTKGLLDQNNWRDSFRHMKYMFNPSARADTKEYADFILGQPELSKQWEMMYDNLNEIQKLTGKVDEPILDYGTGINPKSMLDNITDPKLRAKAIENLKNADKTNLSLSLLEDGVEFLNIPNRWQEHLIRRGAFLGELERLTKREYGIDLIDTINDGKIKDLLNDATSVRPPKARSFNELVADATNRALDATYAKSPEIPVFQSTTSFITRNGLTVVLPFPRFMFNSMELMGQYAGGASIPLAKKVANITTRGKAFPEMSAGKKLSAKDRQRISRNIVGMTAGAPIAPVAIGAFLEDPSEEGDGIVDTVVDYAGSMLQSMSAVGAFYQYRTSEDAPADYKLMNTGNDTVFDTTPQYPLRQFAYLGEAVKRIRSGTFDDWFDGKEFAETFLGTNIRQGMGNSLVEEVINSTMSTDLTSDEKWGRRAGKALGNYLGTWAVPFSQLIEAERALGLRGTGYKDTGEDPTLSGTDSFKKNLQRSFARFESAEAEAERPNREFLFTDKKSRVAPILRVLGGLNITTADDEYGEYIASMGFTDFELGSKSQVPSIRRFENRVVRSSLPSIVGAAKKQEAKLRREYKTLDKSLKERVSEDKYVSSLIRKIITSQIANVRSTVSDKKDLTADAPLYAQAMLGYRRLSPGTRSAAGIQFLKKYKREPNPTDFGDVRALLDIGKALDSALR